MNKYVYSICSGDEWPGIESVMGTSITDAEEKVIATYCDVMDIEDDGFDYREFQEYLNSEYNVVLSDLYDIEEL